MAKKKTEEVVKEPVKKHFKERSFMVNYGDFIGLFDVTTDGNFIGNVTVEGKKYNFLAELKEV